MESRSRVYATILPAAGPELTDSENEQRLAVRTVNPLSPGNRVREVQVTGSAEVCCPADRVSVRVSLCSSKESVNEVTVTFSDFEMMERVCSVLLEKLDKSVCVGTPHFYHSDEGLSQVRRRACASAVENAQQKAQEVSQLLGQTLGPPLLVREEKMTEHRMEEEDGGRAQGAHLPCTPKIIIFSQVSVSFSLRDRSRKKL
ncbi:interleukin-1 receptor-associated kinase 1-binding protein 1 homolog isoform X2 [Antennarius striatus]|uniref:interleukin-1 receptor-associated kinase 1-binding protein 1 homolog isoform X2 n=1 Tax=Antennarius striatus TaxID=241820 RepID=UPI0035B0BE9C